MYRTVVQLGLAIACGKLVLVLVLCPADSGIILCHLLLALPLGHLENVR